MCLQDKTSMWFQGGTGESSLEEGSPDPEEDSQITAYSDHTEQNGNSNFFPPWLVKEKHQVSWWKFTEKVNRFFPLNVDYFCVIKVSEWIKDNCSWVGEAGAGRLCRRYADLKEVWVVSYRNIMGCFIKWMGLNSKSSNWLHRLVDSLFCSHVQFSDTLSLFQGLHTWKNILTPNTSAAVFCLEALPLMGFWFPPPSVHREDIVQEEIKKTPTV